MPNNEVGVVCFSVRRQINSLQLYSDYSSTRLVLGICRILLFSPSCTQSFFLLAVALTHM